MSDIRGKTYAQILRREPPACSCPTCSAMCTLPCFGTPAEMQRLIDSGYGERLCVELWTHAGRVFERDIYMLTPALKGCQNPTPKGGGLSLTPTP